MCRGTGIPLHHRTAAALRGEESGAELVLKAPRWTALYCRPPKDPTATRDNKLSFDEPMSRNLGIRMPPLLRCAGPESAGRVFSITSMGPQACGDGRDEGTLVYACDLPPYRLRCAPLQETT